MEEKRRNDNEYLDVPVCDVLRQLFMQMADPAVLQKPRLSYKAHQGTEVI